METAAGSGVDHPPSTPWSKPSSGGVPETI